MSEEIDDVLRRSLDEVDQTRKRQWTYLAVSLVCLACFLISIWLTTVNTGHFRLGVDVLVGTLIVALTDIFIVVTLSLFINRMTGRILKAIELLSKQQG